MPATVTFNQAAFRDFVNSPNGGVARRLKQEADKVVLETKQHLSVPAPPRKKGERIINTSKIPWERTGDLKRSVRAVQMYDIKDRTLIYGITASAVHSGVQYSAELLAKGFQLAPPRITNRG